LHTRSEIEARSQRLDEMARQQALTRARGRLAQIIMDKLSSVGINAHSIAINFTTNNQGETVLESVEITLDSTHRHEEAAVLQYLQSELGCVVWLHFAV
jgi:hypothetical protein